MTLWLLNQKTQHIISISFFFKMYFWLLFIKRLQFPVKKKEFTVSLKKMYNASKQKNVRSKKSV